MTKILLVEDDKSLREIYGTRLMAEGYEIVSAGDGEEALAMAIKERPTLIVSDVMMPKISGFDMLDILRSTTETKDVKVIMMTALSSEEQRARGEALGADRYLVKSQVGIEDVVRTVHEVLGDNGAIATPAPAPVVIPAPETPAPEPIASTPAPTMPEPTFVAPPIAPIPAPETPAPVVAPNIPPIINAPVEPVVAPAPTPTPMVAPVPVPTPTPIAPSPEETTGGLPDFSAMMSQELGGTPPATPPTPVPPAPEPPQTPPATPPMPPAPTV